MAIGAATEVTALVTPVTPAAMDRTVLTPIVRRALDVDTAEILEWRHTPIDYPVVSPLSGGLHRFAGTAVAGDRHMQWSIVLKVVRFPGGEARDPGALSYWRREPLVYRSGLLRGLDEGLIAPRCFGVEEHAGDTAFLWLEDVADDLGPSWPPRHYLQVAYHLGRFGGWYAAFDRLPEHSWLGHGMIAAVANQRGGAMLGLIRDGETWRHPLVRRAFTEPIAGRLLRLWTEREQLLGALERLPRTLCHFDASRHNLIARRAADGGWKTVAIDWAVTGIGALGEDLSLLVPSPFFRLEADVADLPDHAEHVYQSYLQGLGAAGWSGAAVAVRFAYTVSTALRTVFLSPGLPALLDTALGREEEQRWGRPFEAIVLQRARLTYFLLDLADEARSLLDRL